MNIKERELLTFFLTAPDELYVLKDCIPYGMFSRDFGRLMNVVMRLRKQQGALVELDKDLLASYSPELSESISVSNPELQQEAIKDIISVAIISLCERRDLDKVSEILTLWSKYISNHLHQQQSWVEPTGIKVFDDLLQGYKSGELWVFIGGTGVGKTLTLLDLFRRAKASKLYVSIADCDKEQLSQRLNKKEDEPYIVDLTGVDNISMLSIERMIAKNPVKLLFIDYLTEIITGIRDWRFLAANVFREVRRLAKKYGCCIITAVQAIAGKIYGRVKIEDIAEAKVMLSKSADVIIGIGKSWYKPVLLYNIAKARRPIDLTSIKLIEMSYDLNRQMLVENVDFNGGDNV